GIRDPLVTGVQTCALPICFSGVADPVGAEPAPDKSAYSKKTPGRSASAAIRLQMVKTLWGFRTPLRANSLFVKLSFPSGWIAQRSEERRVGHVCRCGSGVV